nr:calcium-binding protein LPS1-alpha-like [Lytechinus pictus]
MIVIELEKEFKTNYDRDGDGTFSSEELAQIFEGKYSKEEIQNMIAKVDANNDGVMQFEEFLLHMQGKTKRDLYTRDEIEAMFKTLDVNDDGKISAEELSKGIVEIYSKVLENMASNLIKEADEDGDGFVDYTGAREELAKGFDEPECGFDRVYREQQIPRNYEERFLHIEEAKVEVLKGILTVLKDI